jgi:hypothetical protein
MFASIVIDTSGDVGKELWISAAAGILPALVAELLLARGAGAETGALELPHKIGRRYVDLGSLAAIPIGVVAAVIAGYLRTPVQEVTKGTVVTRTMDLDKLIAVAAVAGLTSTSFLRLVQDRFIAVAQNQRLDASLKSALGSLDTIANQAQAATNSSDHATKIKNASSDDQAKQVTADLMEPFRAQAAGARDAAIAAAGQALHR